MELISSNKCYGGLQNVYSHDSSILLCKMKFGVYFPENCLPNTPVLIYLSGLTCTENNVITKSGFQKFAAEHNIAIICPDTSPRGLNLPGEDDSWDFGSGAGFYLNATKAPFDKNYKMEDYIVKELVPMLGKNELINLSSNKIGITGHSMGGLGALNFYLNYNDIFKSCSAFSPIVNPVECPWGQKAFSGYFNNPSEGEKYDPTLIIKNFKKPVKILIDQGLSDSFYENQLFTKNFTKAVKNSNVDHEIYVRFHEGYDHSYYFISSFIGEHVKYHAEILK